MMKEKEINLLQIFTIFWKKKTHFILIVLFSLSVGIFYNSSQTEDPFNIEVSLNLNPSKDDEFIKFLNITRIFKGNQIFKNFKNDGLKKSSNKEVNFSNYKLNSFTVLEKFVLEILDYEEVKQILRKYIDINKNLSEEDQRRKLYQYLRLFSLKNNEEGVYVLRFRWNNEDQAISILNEILELTSINLKKLIFREIESLLVSSMNRSKLKDINRVVYLREQSAIAKELGLEENSLNSFRMSEPNVSLNINSNQGRVYYLRGYKAIDKEIELIEKREYIDFKNIKSEIEIIKKLNTKWVNYNIYLYKKKLIVNNEKTNILVLSTIIGILFGILYILIINILPFRKII